MAWLLSASFGSLLEELWAPRVRVERRSAGFGQRPRDPGPEPSWPVRPLGARHAWKQAANRTIRVVGHFSSGCSLALLALPAGDHLLWGDQIRRRRGGLQPRVRPGLRQGAPPVGASGQVGWGGLAGTASIRSPLIG